MSESRKQKAEMAREAYTHHLSGQGIHLSRVIGTREVVYKTVSNKTVRIPFANEKTKGDAWWWGLPDARDFDIVILLCNTRDGRRLDFVLPADFLLPLWDSLLPDKQGGVNFMIERRHSDYRLVLKGGRLRPVHTYLGRTDFIS